MSAQDKERLVRELTDLVFKGAPVEEIGKLAERIITESLVGEKS